VFELNNGIPRILSTGGIGQRKLRPPISAAPTIRTELESRRHVKRTLETIGTDKSYREIKLCTTKRLIITWMCDIDPTCSKSPTNLHTRVNDCQSKSLYKHEVTAHCISYSVLRPVACATPFSRMIWPVFALL